jgi:MFS family permease
MNEVTMTPGTGRAFYGWTALTGASLAAFFNAGIFLFSYGVFLPVMCTEFGWSRAVVAAGLSLGVLTSGLPSPLIGASVTKFGPRINMVLGNLLLALGLAGMSLAQEVWHVYLFYGLAGIGSGFGGYIPSSTVPNNWFIKKRSLAIGISLAAVGVGGFAFPPIVTALLSSFGWRISWLVLAGMVFVGACLIGGLILVRNRPEDMGQVPDGISIEPAMEAGTTDYLSGTGQEPTEWPTKLALRQPTTWLIAVFTSSYMFSSGTMTGHQVAYLQDLSFSPMVAATTLSLVSGLSIIGNLGFGALALRFNIRYLATASFAIRLISLGILMTTENLALIYVYAILFGVCNGALALATPTFLGNYYGRAHFAQILGVLFALSVSCLAAGPIVAGAIFDNSGTYMPAFVLITALSLVGLICAFMARQPKLPQP